MTTSMSEIIPPPVSQPQAGPLSSSKPETACQMQAETGGGITVHCLIRNEERFIKAAILSVLPLAKRILVYDTGSSDATIEVVSSIQSDLSAVPSGTGQAGKIELVRKTFSSPRELTRFRNEMIERTTTEWFMVVDGDEIYPAQAIQGIAQALPHVAPTIHQIKVHRKHFLGSLNFISPVDCLGRIYRTSQIRHRTGYPLRRRLRADTPYLRDNPLASLKPHSMRLPEGIFFFHCQYLIRSSKDAELGRLRRWRTPPFPARPYFGPWPKTLELDGVAHRMSPQLWWAWIGLNARLLGARGLGRPWAPPEAGAPGAGAEQPQEFLEASDPGRGFRREPRKAITVMFLQTSLRIGGAEMMVTQLIERLDRRRFRPMLCCLYEPGVLAANLITADIPVYHSFAAHRWDLRVGLRLLLRLWRERVDVLYIINQPLTQFWGTLCGRLAGVPVLISTIHSTGKVSRIRRRRWVNWFTFRFVDRITALSQTHKTYLVDREGIDPGKLEIISNGIEVERFAANQDVDRLRARLGLGDDEPVVGIVAMLRPEKAHEVFLRSAAQVLAQVPTARFLIVGEGPERPRLEALAKTLGIAARVHFVGARQDVPALVHLFDVAVLSSRPVVETLSVSVLEYLAAGKPVVATRVGSLPELIEDGRTGFLVEPGDWQALAERIVRLLHDRALADRMGQAGQDMVRAQYTIEQTVHQTEACFERLLDGVVHSPRSTVHREEH